MAYMYIPVFQVLSFPTSVVEVLETVTSIHFSVRWNHFVYKESGILYGLTKRYPLPNKGMKCINTQIFSLRINYIWQYCQNGFTQVIDTFTGVELWAASWLRYRLLLKVSWKVVNSLLGIWVQSFGWRLFD